MTNRVIGWAMQRQFYFDLLEKYLRQVEVIEDYVILRDLINQVSTGRHLLNWCMVHLRGGSISYLFISRIVERYARDPRATAPLTIESKDSPNSVSVSIIFTVMPTCYGISWFNNDKLDNLTEIISVWPTPSDAQTWGCQKGKRNCCHCQETQSLIQLFTPSLSLIVS